MDDLWPLKYDVIFYIKLLPFQTLQPFISAQTNLRVGSCSDLVLSIWRVNATGIASATTVQAYSGWVYNVHLSNLAEGGWIEDQGQ